MTTLCRNVVVVGKTGAGKSTVANKLVGDDVFKVSAGLDVATQTISHCEVTIRHGGKMYHVKVVDTVGLFDRSLRNKDTIAELKKYFKDIFPGGINLVLFVSSKGRFADEEQEYLETIVHIFRKDVSEISALVPPFHMAL